jgi:hypothetical protein
MSYVVCAALKHKKTKLATALRYRTLQTPSLLREGFQEYHTVWGVHYDRGYSTRNSDRSTSLDACFWGRNQKCRKPLPKIIV